MELAELAARFVDADNAKREGLLQSLQPQAEARLAYVLKDTCLDAWSGDPVRATRAAIAQRHKRVRTSAAPPAQRRRIVGRVHGSTSPAQRR